MRTTVYIFGVPFDCDYHWDKEAYEEGPPIYNVFIDAIWDGRLQLDLSAHGQDIEDKIILALVEQIEDMDYDPT